MKKGDHIRDHIFNWIQRKLAEQAEKGKAEVQAKAAPQRVKRAS